MASKQLRNATSRSRHHVRSRSAAGTARPFGTRDRLAHGPLAPEASFAAKLLLQREHVTYVFFCVGSLPFLEH
jgi:hypothetical protein